MHAAAVHAPPPNFGRRAGWMFRIWPWYRSIVLATARAAKSGYRFAYAVRSGSGKGNRDDRVRCRYGSNRVQPGGRASARCRDALERAGDPAAASGALDRQRRGVAGRHPARPAQPGRRLLLRPLRRQRSGRRARPWLDRQRPLGFRWHRPGGGRRHRALHPARKRCSALPCARR